MSENFLSKQWKPMGCKTIEKQNKTNKKNVFEWTVPLNDLGEFVQRFHTIVSSDRKMVFVFNTIIASSPDRHYCLVGGVVTERPEASKRGCACNLNEEMRNGGWGWLLTSWIREEEPPPPKATLESFSFLPGPLPWPDWTHVKGKTEITGWDV